jgi:hypothetical protein
MTALTQQIGGDHYKELAIQPVEYIHANSIPFIEGCIIKYATRWRDKGGLQDLHKIIHFTQMLIDFEFKIDKLPKDFGCQNMIDPADVELYEEPAAAIDDESPRAYAIGQNGNTGEHYADTWAGAPDWVKCKAQDADGEWYFYEREPHFDSGADHWHSEHKLISAAIPNPNWRTTLISR